MNVKDKLRPVARFRELKRPPSAVTVWVVPSRFVKVTRVPEWTLRVEGMKAKLMMLTDAPIIGGGVERGVEITGCGVGVGVSTGVAEAVGDAVDVAAAGDA
jgi:hypothetical protein